METLYQKIKENASLTPEKTAVVFKGESLTYRELEKRIREVASRLKELGVEKGDRVLFSAVSKPSMPVIYQAIQYIGAIAVFVDKNATPANMKDIYEDADAKIIFTDKPLKEFGNKMNSYSLNTVYKETGSEDITVCGHDEEEIAELIYTSGTTGKAKGCMLSYDAVNHIWENTVKGIGMKEEDIVLLPLPLNHSFALRVFRAAISIGATVVLQNGFTFAKEIENNLNTFHCTGIAVVPASIETISRQMQDRFAEIMSKFRYIEASAGSLSIEQRKRLVELLPNTEIHNTWGSSESGGALFLNVSDVVKNHPEKIGALGKPLENIDIKVLNESNVAFKSDETHPGRMTIRGRNQMSGYWKRKELNEKTIVDGWLLTGDMVYIDEDGYLYMLGRADDIINVGGEKVSPIEVENIAIQYPGIFECACVGAEDPDGILGSVPYLFVVTSNTGYSEEDFRHYLSENLERYKLPSKIIEVMELPRNAMQKINRSALKEMTKNADGNSLFNKTIQTILTRRSIRIFKEEAIDRKLLEMIVKAGYYAPSGHNMQTWRFTVITDKKQLERLKTASKETAEKNGVNFYGWENPQAIILVSNDKRNKYGCQDASCANENMMLAAWSLGIGSVWLNPLLELRDKEPVASLLDEYKIPRNHIVYSAIALGYPVKEGAKLKKNEQVVCWVD